MVLRLGNFKARGLTVAYYGDGHGVGGRLGTGVTLDKILLLIKSVGLCVYLKLSRNKFYISRFIEIHSVYHGDTTIYFVINITISSASCFITSVGYWFYRTVGSHNTWRNFITKEISVIIKGSSYEI
jgi:hypothetical protein